MKKCIYLAGAVMSAFLLTGCLKDFGNSISGGKGYATVISSDASNKLFQADVDGACHFFSNDVNAKTELQKGDRFFISYMTLDFDNQPSNAQGTKTNPYRLDGMTFEKVNVSESDFIDETHNGAHQDTIVDIVSPVFAHSTLNGGTYFLSFAGGVPAGSKPELELLYDYSKTSNDTLFYELRVVYGAVGSDEKNETFMHSFKIDNIVKEKGVIVVNYYAKYFSQNQYLWSAITKNCDMTQGRVKSVITYDNSSKN